MPTITKSTINKKKSSVKKAATKKAVTKKAAAKQAAVKKPAAKKAPVTKAAVKPAAGALVSVGAAAPDFKLMDSAGKAVALSSLKGKPVVVYFYPKDDTSGCTAEACDFRDNLAQFKKLGCTVLGISPDSVKSHAKFVTSSRSVRSRCWPMSRRPRAALPPCAPRTACGRRRACTVAPTWAWCERPMSSRRTARSRSALTR